MEVVYRALGSSGALWVRARNGTMDELLFEELSLRRTQEKMNDAFCDALQRAINAGAEKAPSVVSKQPSTRNPKTLTAA
jgi:hypothetical protein